MVDGLTQLNVASVRPSDTMILTVGLPDTERTVAMKALIKVSDKQKTGQILLVCPCRGKYTLHKYTHLGEFTKDTKTECEGVMEHRTFYAFEVQCMICQKKSKIGQDLEDFDSFLDCIPPWCMSWIDPLEIAV